jgi:hypothetical protein
MPISVIDGTGDGPTTTTTALTRAGLDPAEVVVEVCGLRMSYDGFEAARGSPRTPIVPQLMLWRNLSGEKMTVKFEPSDGGGTGVTINGSVARAKRQLATDPGH